MTITHTLRYALVSKDTGKRPKETYLYAKGDLQMTSIAEVCVCVSVKRGLLVWQKRPTKRDLLKETY